MVPLKNKKPQKSMRYVLAKWQIIFLVIAFIITLLLSFYFQTQQATETVDAIMEDGLEDLFSEVDASIEKIQLANDLISKNMLIMSNAVAEIINSNKNILNSSEELNRLCQEFKINEIQVTDANGIIIASSNGLETIDLKSDPQWTAFLPALTSADFSLVQAIEKESNDLVVHYAGISRKDQPGLVLIEYSNKSYQKIITQKNIDELLEHDKLGAYADVIFCNASDNKIIASSFEDQNNLTLDEIGISPETLMGKKGSFTAKINGEKSLCQFLKNDDNTYLAIATLPQSIAYKQWKESLVILIALFLFLIALIFAITSCFMNYFLIKGIKEMNGSLQKITQGALDEKVSVFSNLEFSELSQGINQTVDALKIAIEKETTRIDKELEYARDIQMATLPKKTPDFGKGFFEIAAGIYPAKEVGGDFYDFFMIDDTHLGIVIADVSGKGIPAALYMMSAKNKVQSALHSKGELGKIFNSLNNALCQENDQMFVTLFAAIINVHSGEMRFVNAGHNPPLISMKEGDPFAYMQEQHSFFLGSIEDMPYQEHQIHLKKESILFLYTDGVTEAMTKDEQLFGEDRLLTSLNKERRSSEDYVKLIKKDLENFVNGAEPSDDITLLVFKLI